MSKRARMIPITRDLWVRTEDGRGGAVVAIRDAQNGLEYLTSSSPREGGNGAPEWIPEEEIALNGFTETADNVYVTNMPRVPAPEKAASPSRGAWWSKW